jgi:hypothetical protein
MTPDIYLDIPSPFGLSRPTPAWCAVIAAFDPELRIFPSQTHPLYRLMRLAKNTPVGATIDRMHTAMQKGLLKDLHPDTRIAIQHRMVSVFTLPKEVTTVSPERVVQTLQKRDQWAFKDGDAVADALDQRDQIVEQAAKDERKREYRIRRKAAGISLLYRTGARVSLVPPVRVERAGSLGTPGGNPAVTVSPKE